jgi:hypothetical protein
VREQLALTPGRQVHRRPDIERDHLEHPAGHRPQPLAQVEHELAAAEIAGILFRVGMKGIVHVGSTRLRPAKRCVPAQPACARYRQFQVDTQRERTAPAPRASARTGKCFAQACNVDRVNGK